MRQNPKVKINAGIVHEGDLIFMRLADGTTQKAQAGRTRVWPCPPLTHYATVNGKVVVDLDPMEVIDEDDRPEAKRALGRVRRQLGKDN